MCLDIISLFYYNSTAKKFMMLESLLMSKKWSHIRRTWNHPNICGWRSRVKSVGWKTYQFPLWGIMLWRIPIQCHFLEWILELEETRHIVSLFLRTNLGFNSAWKNHTEPKQPDISFLSWSPAWSPTTEGWPSFCSTSVYCKFVSMIVLDILI